MLASKTVHKIVVALMAAAVAVCLLAMGFSEALAAYFGGEGVKMEYESKLFDTDSILTIDISIDPDDWEEMLETAINEEYYECDVTINGTTFYRVGIRPKGNTSLSSIANDPDTDRYSFKLEFDQYVEGQTCWGLDKLVLNNNYADATNMKEALVYDMFQYLGADASLYNYAAISVNGEYWGIYLALEAVEDSFLLRNYGVSSGDLYKPEGMGMGGGGSLTGGGADLNYTDDDPDSYETIWEGEVTDTTDADHKRVVTALQKVSEGEDLESYLDVDNLLKYMAVHSFVVNDDSLSGNMAHNYYLYEENGQLNIIPWDYNLAFGGMGMGANGAEGVINDPIDTPFSGTDFFDGLLENETYLEWYHSYYRQLVEEYVEGGQLEGAYRRIREQIDDWVASDPTALYSYEEYLEAADMLYDTILLRAESVEGQLDGTIPSTDEGQRADSSGLIDASFIDLSVMGTMNGGGGGENRGGKQMETGEAPADEVVPTAFMGAEPMAAEIAPDAAPGDEPPSDAETPAEGTSEPASDSDAAGSGDSTETYGAGQQPGNFDPTEMATPPEDAGQQDPGAAAFGDRGNGPGGNRGVAGFENAAASAGTNQVWQNALWFGGCLLLMVAALILAGIYRRRPKIKRRQKSPKALPPAR